MSRAAAGTASSPPAAAEPEPAGADPVDPPPEEAVAPAELAPPDEAVAPVELAPPAEVLATADADADEVTTVADALESDELPPDVVAPLLQAVASSAAPSTAAHPRPCREAVRFGRRPPRLGPDGVICPGCVTCPGCMSFSSRMSTMTEGPADSTGTDPVGRERARTRRRTDRP
ncbi:hypothetical protein GCM10011594_13200 [Nakamurella endophytica]|uniref:Uncharacterized protein n=1 Tax=Nakamurella endophytica TaxID=1748367 RepID=A0A917SSJ2_9ACTN|nr:hypothetical protein GCM10011594_13200 [Nakamurella endophytica]